MDELLRVFGVDASLPFSAQILALKLCYVVIYRLEQGSQIFQQNRQVSDFLNLLASLLCGARPAYYHQSSFQSSTADNRPNTTRRLRLLLCISLPAVSRGHDDRGKPQVIFSCLFNPGTQCKHTFKFLSLMPKNITKTRI